MMLSLKNKYWMQLISTALNEKKAILGVSIFLILLFASLFSDIIWPLDPNTQGDISLDRYLSPSIEHPFGTDKFGRDVFSRVLFGGRISLLIALSVVSISVLFGIIYGSIAGYIGGRTDKIMMHVLDFLLAFPMIFLIITIIAIFKIMHWYLIPIIAFTSWMETARLIRAEVLTIKEREYITAATGLGLSHFRILFRHILPNCVSIIIVTIPLKIAEVILLESALSFLGIGIQPPTASWGSLINDGREVLMSAWWIATFPGLFITFTVLSFNLMSESIKKVIRHQ